MLVPQSPLSLSVMAFLTSKDNHFEECVKHSIVCFVSVYLYNPVSLSLSPSCLPSSGTTQSQSLTSVPIVPSHLPTLATWPNMSASTLEWNPTPAPSAKSASDNSVTFSSTTGKWITGLRFLIRLGVSLRSGGSDRSLCMFVFFIQDSHWRSAIQVWSPRLWEILHTALKFTGVNTFCFLLVGY